MFESMLSEKEKKLKDEVREFVKGVSKKLILDMDSERIKYPREFLRKAAKRNLLGLRFEKEYGGRNLKWTSEILALEEIGVLGTSLACLYSLPSIVGEAIAVFGTTEQKRKYLKPTLKGEMTCAEALTEPRGGSDFFGTTTTAEKRGDHYILNGYKRFIVGAEGADYFLIYAKTGRDAPPRNSLSAFIVERDFGIEVKHLYGLLGTRGGGTGRILLKDVKVPSENLVGRENGGGNIFYRMMIPERMTSAAGAIGLARGALEVATRYSEKRVAFGKKIRNFQGVSFKVAESVTRLDAARGLVYAAARTADDLKDPDLARRLVSEAKKFSTEASFKVINDSMQIMGGIGYTNVYPIERLLRDARLIMIWTGTNEIMNLIIQHEYYKELLRHVTRNVEDDAPESDRMDEK
ncbi:MAG: acyl-CoA dehydrogenase family protein, partial [Candidatus Methanofastidiosia archaeon]